MIDESQEYIRELRDLYRDKGIEAARAEVDSAPIQHRQAMDSVLNEFEEKERHIATFNQNEELRRLAVHTLDEQRNGNEIQKNVLWVLAATLIVTILVAFFKKG